MSEMVERVARAIFGAWAADVGSSHSWEDLKQATVVASEDEVPTLHRMQRQAYAEARAAIEAMREPTDRMLHLADGYTDLSGYHPTCDSTWRKDEFRTAWQVMIDDALGKDAITGEPRHDRL